MLHPGLVSITFRQLTPAEIIALVAQAGLSGIEWGGDVHVPPGDPAQAQTVARMTAEAGLQVAAYGSYYRLSHPDSGPFEAVLQTAVALGAPAIRVWAGRQGTDQADEVYWQAVVDDSRRCADLAAEAGITLVYEFHGNTLTDTNEAARTLLERVNHPHLKSYWQPPRYSKLADNLAGLEAVFPWLYGLHVFTWHAETGQRLPLVEGADLWAQYLAKASAKGEDQFALIEFVVDDAPEQFLRDAATLKTWLSQ